MRSACLTALGAVLLLVGPAHAVPVSFAFESVYEPIPGYEPFYPPGTNVSVSLSFDTDTFRPRVGFFLVDGSAALEAEGAHLVEQGTLQAILFDDFDGFFPVEPFDRRLGADYLIFTFPGLGHSINFIDPTGEAFDASYDLSGPFDLDRWTSVDVRAVAGCSIDTWPVRCQSASHAVIASVPEPSVALLIAAGALASWLSRRRCARRFVVAGLALLGLGPGVAQALPETLEFTVVFEDVPGAEPFRPAGTEATGHLTLAMARPSGPFFDVEGLASIVHEGVDTFVYEEFFLGFLFDDYDPSLGILPEHYAQPGADYVAFVFVAGPGEFKQLFFIDPTGRALNGTTEFVAPFDPMAWPTAQLRIADDCGFVEGASFCATESRGVLRRVPEPSTALLLAVGLILASRAHAAGRRPA